MTSFEVAQLFRRYCDEPDQSFINDLNLAQYLKIGYAEFLNFINEVNSHTRIRGTIINMNGLQLYDLTQLGTLQVALGTPSVLGPNPNEQRLLGPAPGIPSWAPTGRMTRLIAVQELTATHEFIRQFQIVPGETSMAIGNNTCLWTGDQLAFKMPIAGDIMIFYNYEQEIGLGGFLPGPVTAGQTDQTWVGAPISIPNGVVLDDDMGPWHDMIALMAYAQYSIVDDSANQNVLVRLATRKQEFINYLQDRNAGDSRYVVPTINPMGGF